MTAKKPKTNRSSGKAGAARGTGAAGSERPGFMGERIDVKFDQKAGWKEPQAFVSRGKEYVVARVLSSREDHGFGAAPATARWWQRRHRVYYQVETPEGEVFELYWDRGAKKKEWVLVRRIRAVQTVAEAEPREKSASEEEPPPPEEGAAQPS